MIPGGTTLGFSTLDREVALARLPVRGTIPAWLSGTLIRNGPARFEVGPQKFRHWFDGQAMLHAFAFRGGAVSYANRFLRGRAYTAAAAAGRIVFREFATDPCRTLFGRVFSLFKPQLTDNACVNIARLADRFVAMTETPLAVEFDGRTLDTLGVFGYEDRLPGQVTTAHPHFDRERRELVNYLTEFGPRSRYRVYGLGAGTAARRLIGTIPVREPAYMHSFGMTARYVVLVEFPLVVSPIRLLLSGRPFIENFRWKPARGARFHVLDRADGASRGTWQAEPFFAFHHVNAFEEGDDVVVDVAAYPDASIIGRLYLDRVVEAGAPIGRLRRYRLRAGTDRAEGRTLSEAGLDLPRIDYGRRNASAYRYVYGVGSTDAVEFTNQLVKIDVASGAAATWQEDGCYPGEPVFVRGPADGGEEDDGVLLSVVLDARARRSFLLVLCARSLEEIGRAEVPHHIPFGFHGQFLTGL